MEEPQPCCLRVCLMLELEDRASAMESVLGGVYGFIPYMYGYVPIYVPRIRGTELRVGGGDRDGDVRAAHAPVGTRAWGLHTRLLPLGGGASLGGHVLGAVCASPLALPTLFGVWLGDGA